MTIDIRLVPGPVRAVPRVGVPFAPVPPAAPPRCPASRPLPPPPDIRLPVMTVGGARPDRTGNVDLAPFLAGFVSHVGDSSIHHTAAEIGQIAAGKVAEVVDGAPAALDTLREIADVIGTEAGSGAAGILKRVADLEIGKANKGEMSITPVAGSPDKTTIQLKDGTSATMLTEHQDVSGKVDKIPGKGLSENDYTDADKAKLAGLSPQAQADWGQTDTTAPDFIKNKPTIPAPVTIDLALSTTSENPVQNKVIAEALSTGFTEWEISVSGYGVRWVSGADGWVPFFIATGSAIGQPIGDAYSTYLEWTRGTSDVPFTATRRLITPTKTSQLTNDGPSSGPNAGHPFATTNQIPAPVDISGKLDGAAAYPAWEASPSSAYVAGTVVSYSGRLYRLDNLGLYGPDLPPIEDIEAWTEVLLKDLKQDALSAAQMDAVNSGATAAKVATWDGYAAQIAAKANAAAVNVALALKADADALPYALVTPGEWEFSGSGVTSGHVYSVVETEGDGYWSYSLADNGTEISVVDVGFRVSAGDAVDFEDQGSPSVSIVATRLSGIHLLDRAVNAVPVSSATGITLPEKIAGGKSRDLYVRFSVSAESAVTFAATDSGGDAVSWDSMGSPSGTFAIGTYLYRLTEVADGVFHAADITNGGSIDPAVLDEKLDASSAAPPFSESLTYLVGEYVTYGGVLYRCKTAVTVAGTWTGTSNWEEDDMTSPDATLDIMSDGRLRVVTVAGEDLWMQGYDLESTSAQVLKCEKVNLLSFPATTASAFDSTATYAVGDSVVYGGMVYKFTAAHSAGDWIGTDAAVDSVSLTMPYVPVGKVGDFVLDVDNSANASVKMVAELSGLFTAFDVFVDKGRNLSDLLTFDGGEQCELYFTMTAFGTQAKPAWKVVKQVVEKQGYGS